MSKGKKRFWSDDEKREICDQARVADVSVAQVARCYAMNANLIHKWMRDPRFAPVAEDFDIAENKDVTSYNLRALVEFRVGSKDCKTSKQYAKKAAELGATADTYIVSGSIWVECGDLKEGTNFFEKALRLQPNDSGWNLTKRLIPMYYLQDEYKKIVSLVEPHLDAVDIAPEMLAFYAFAKLQEGQKALALTMFDRAKEMGISKNTLNRVIRDPSKTDQFILELSELGSID